MLSDLVITDLSDGDGQTCADFLESLGARLTRRDRARPLSEREFEEAASASDAVILGAGARDVVEAATRDVTSPRYEDGLVAVAVTPFGLTGPYSRFRGGELVASAMGGVLGICGYPDRPPVKEAGDACGFHANVVAAAGAVFALYERGLTGKGQLVDVSVQEVAASRTTNSILAWQFDKRRLKRSGPAINYGRAPVRCVWRLSDGFVFHSLMTGRFGAPANQALSDWMDERQVDNPLQSVDWFAYDRSALPAETRAVWEQAIATFFETVSREEIATEGRRRGINAVALNEPCDLLKDKHLAARAFFQDAEVDGRSIKVPSRFLRLAEPRPASASGRSRSKAGDDGGPLAGVKVLDFSWALVGSFATKTLGDFGAQVVKVESAKRPCLSRIDVQTSVSKRGDFDDKPWFAHMNTSKLSLRLNLKHADAREVLDPLIEWADIVVENFSPGTMASLGLDYESLAARRPDLIMVSGSVYGQTGPLAKEWGVDGTGAALSGRLYLTGWSDRTPVPPSAAPYGDVILPPMMAAAAIAALRDRDRTGRGRHIDASMYEACAMQMKDALVRSQLGDRPQRDGNRDRDTLHQGVYPTSGEDRWIALSFGDASEWDRFKALAEGAAWPEDLSRLSASERDALDALIGEWTQHQSAHALMMMCQNAGVAAGAVQDGADIVDLDPQLQARDFLAEVDHAALGGFKHQSTPIGLSRSPRAMLPAPRLGEHTDMICREIVGLDAARVAALHDAGLFD